MKKRQEFRKNMFLFYRIRVTDLFFTLLDRKKNESRQLQKLETAAMLINHYLITFDKSSRSHPVSMFPIEIFRRHCSLARANRIFCDFREKQSIELKQTINFLFSWPKVDVKVEKRLSTVEILDQLAFWLFL